MFQLSFLLTYQVPLDDFILAKKDESKMNKQLFYYFLRELVI